MALHFDVVVRTVTVKVEQNEKARIGSVLATSFIVYALRFKTIDQSRRNRSVFRITLE